MLSASGFPWAQSTSLRAALVRPELLSGINPEAYVNEAAAKTVSKTDFLETDSETGESTATLVIENARYEMFDYTLYAYASSSSGIYLAGYAQLEVIPVKNFEITDCQNSGSYITVCCPEEGDYTLYIAGYDSFGKLEAVEIAPLHFTRGKAGYNTQKPLADYPDIRVMLWGEDITPLSKLYSGN